MKWMSLILMSVSLMPCALVAAQPFSGLVETIKGEPIKDATVSLQQKNISLTTKTDTKGQFLFKEVLSGKYFLSAEKKHMLTFGEPTTVSANDKTSTDIKLIPIEFAIFHYLPVHVAYS